MMDTFVYNGAPLTVVRQHIIHVRLYAGNLLTHPTGSSRSFPGPSSSTHAQSGPDRALSNLIHVLGQTKANKSHHIGKSSMFKSLPLTLCDPAEVAHGFGPHSSMHRMQYEENPNAGPMQERDSETQKKSTWDPSKFCAVRLFLAVCLNSLAGYIHSCIRSEAELTSACFTLLCLTSSCLILSRTPYTVQPLRLQYAVELDWTSSSI